MRKADIQRSYHNGSRGEPMLNIKIYGPVPQSVAAQVEADSGMTGFAAWYAAQDSDDVDWAWQVACEDGVEQATDVAGDIFGDAYGKHAHDRRRVWQAGRSGGWLYVNGLDDIDGWDAIAVSRWGRFATRIEDIVNDTPYRFLMLLAINDYASQCEMFDDAETMRDKILADAAADYFHAVPA